MIFFKYSFWYPRKNIYFNLVMDFCLQIFVPNIVSAHDSVNFGAQGQRFCYDVMQAHQAHCCSYVLAFGKFEKERGFGSGIPF